MLHIQQPAVLAPVYHLVKRIPRDFNNKDTEGDRGREGKKIPSQLVVKEERKKERKKERERKREFYLSPDAITSSFSSSVDVKGSKYALNKFAYEKKKERKKERKKKRESWDTSQSGE